MTNRIMQLDKLIYNDIKNIKDGDNFELSYTREGFTDIELESRLKKLSTDGFLKLNESIGQITVCGISKSGHTFFQSII